MFCLMLVVSYQEFGLPGGLVVKNLPAVQETGVQFLGREDLEEGMATHSSSLFWRIPWTEEPAGCDPWAPKELYISSSRGTRMDLPSLWLRQNSIQLNYKIPVEIILTFITFPFDM